MARRVTVVVSQGQSAHPDKRRLEESLVTHLLGAPGVELVVVPHLYDLAADSTGMMCLEGIAGDMIVASWLFPRAAHWTLDRQGIRGRVGRTQMQLEDEDAEDEDAFDDHSSNQDTEADSDVGPSEGAASSGRPLPDRTIYCLDLRSHPDAQPYLDEIRRIVAEASIQTFSILPASSARPATIIPSAAPAATAPALRRDKNSPAGADASPTTSVPAGFIDLFGAGAADPRTPAPGATSQQQPAPTPGNGAAAIRVDEAPARRWYPVIDYSRCTNCMECIDFCLFGVYGVDRAEQILVEQPDNCRKGCPACSRVCPANAIMFPQHKTPGIAGSDGESAGGIKIDLSQLFGAPTAIELAAQERDVELVAVGRDAVGLSMGIPKRQAGKPTAPKDDLDSLIDQLDDFV